MAVPHRLGTPVVERPLIANFADQVPVAVRQGLVVEQADRIGVADLGHLGRGEQLTLHGNIVDVKNAFAHLDLVSRQTDDALDVIGLVVPRSEEHTSELQSLMRISYAVFCLKKKNKG